MSLNYTAQSLANACFQFVQPWTGTLGNDKINQPNAESEVYTNCPVYEQVTQNLL